jgi:hypothetical protein
MITYHWIGGISHMRYLLIGSVQYLCSGGIPPFFSLKLHHLEGGLHSGVIKHGWKIRKLTSVTWREPPSIYLSLCNYYLRNKV